MSDPSTSTREDPRRTPRNTRSFRLFRYFVATSAVAFAVVAIVVFALQRMEEQFFDAVQNEQARFVAKVQAEFAQRQRDASLASLMAVHEAGHVNLTHVFENALWDAALAPYVEIAGRVPVDDCRAIGPEPEPTDPSVRRAREACFAAVGARMRALPGFARLDRSARDAMAGTTVFKIKVFDPRGITIYSSEHAQVGEDKSGNAGWFSALHGTAASELTHRDRFSAFERVVENRDLVSSYVPVRRGGAGEIVAVFEIYSDATPFVTALSQASATLARTASENDSEFAQAAVANSRAVRESSSRFLLIVYGLLALLYLALLGIVRNGQRVIDRQAREQEKLAQREHEWHREKMSALATMAANVSHEVGNPLEIIAGVAQDVATRLARSDPDTARQAELQLQQARRIANMTRHIEDFASSRSGQWELVDVNAAVKAVCDFVRFDRRFRGTSIAFHPAAGLPAAAAIPDRLNEILMLVLQSVADLYATTPPERIDVGTGIEAGAPRVVIEICCADSHPPIAGMPASPLDFARRRAAEIGATLDVSDRRVELVLARTLPDDSAATPATGRGSGLRTA